MKVLLDEMLPAGVAGLLPGHDVTTVQQAGFKGLTNSACCLTRSGAPSLTPIGLPGALHR